MLGPSEGGLDGQDAPERFPASGCNAYLSIANTFFPDAKMVEDMLEWGIYPLMLKESIGVILPKPGKKDYTDCASFSIIALIQTFWKITERIVNQSHMAIAYKMDMYWINRMGSLPQRSTVDAALSLND